MSWKYRRVYRCESCGKEEVGIKVYHMGFDADSSHTMQHLPDGWTGELNRAGWCFCPECTEARKAVGR